MGYHIYVGIALGSTLSDSLSAHIKFLKNNYLARFLFHNFSTQEQYNTLFWVFFIQFFSKKCLISISLKQRKFEKQSNWFFGWKFSVRIFRFEFFSILFLFLSKLTCDSANLLVVIRINAIFVKVFFSFSRF